MRSAIPLISSLAVISGMWASQGQNALSAPGASPTPSETALTIQQTRGCDLRTRINHLPYSITAPGSYVLARDLSAASAVDGITVSASGVTIDLIGFTLDGANVGLDGIKFSGGVRDVTVINGILRRWTANGIDAGPVECGRFQDLSLESNATTLSTAGLQLGLTCIAHHCSLASNGEVGILVGQNCLVTDCTVGHTNGVGISIENGARSVVRGCTVLRSLGAGIRASGLSAIMDNDLIENAGNGIELLLAGGGRTRIDGNHLMTNGGAGIFVDSSITIVTVVRNFSTGNSPNYSVPAVAGFGPVGPASTATSPWANIEY